MATFIDVTGLHAFSNIFAFLFTWIIIYAILMYTKVIGSNTAIHILLSLIVAVFVLLSDIATNMILTVAPWFGVLFVLATLAAIAFGSGGISTGTPTFQSLKAITLVFFVVIMVLLALGQLGGAKSTTPEGAPKTGLSLITDPRVFGIIIIALISVFTIALLTMKST
ncbi:MAG TPA: hypothetical protein VJI46_06230 [Candidatus Nanoarchaeia archaeon]|nr:hypothetical protein [Candidatus Nanoarchaeia archaeon]